MHNKTKGNLQRTTMTVKEEELLLAFFGEREGGKLNLDQYIFVDREKCIQEKKGGDQEEGKESRA